MSRSRRQRRRLRRARLINYIVIWVDESEDCRRDTVWLIFNVLDPNPLAAHPENLGMHFYAAHRKGEAFVTRHFPGITYKKMRAF